MLCHCIFGLSYHDRNNTAVLEKCFTTMYSISKIGTDGVFISIKDCWTGITGFNPTDYSILFNDLNSVMSCIIKTLYCQCFMFFFFCHDEDCKEAFFSLWLPIVFLPSWFWTLTFNILIVIFLFIKKEAKQDPNCEWCSCAYIYHFYLEPIAGITLQAYCTSHPHVLL